MKKLFWVVTSVILAGPAMAQEEVTEKMEEFDSRYRFGLRITPQPTWFVSGNKNDEPAGAVLGFGFGLNLEYRFSDIASLLTGIGGDFEGGRYKVKYDPGKYEVRYWLNEAGEFLAPKDPKTAGITGYHLKERKVNTTFASIPLILKLSTNEYNGMKYFGMFGAEIGVRIKATASDTYYSYTSYPDSVLHIGEFTESDININEEAGTVPLRFGMNVGMGAEYRLGGSTSLFGSINFFRNFTNFMQKESDFMVYKEEGGEFLMVRHQLMLTGLRLNIGILF